MSGVVNHIRTRADRAKAVCCCCGHQSRPVFVEKDGRGEPGIFELARGWSQAPYPPAFVHSDGSVGSTYHCPSCNKRSRNGETLTRRAYVSTTAECRP